MTTDRRTFLFTAAAVLTTPWHRGRSDELAVVKAFLKRSKPAQQKLVDDLARQLAAIDSPWLRRVQALTENGRRLADVKVTGLAQHAARAPEASPFAELPVAIRTEYLWGHRAVRRADKRVPLVAASGTEKLTLPLENPVEDLLAMVRGLPPDLDLALAGALADLDQVTTADKFALFLESWRNGPESFYRALDRTAGTPQSVFFFDAMLAEFQGRFAPKGGSLKSLKQLHDALHDAFLAYRQYRAMREAAACATVLPEHVRLPACLSRYDSQKTDYGLRDDLLILAQIDKHDPLAGLQLINTTTAPLPEPLWATGGKYDALVPFQTTFAERLEQALDAAKEGETVSSDGMRAAQIAERAAVSAKIAEVARQALTP